MTLTLPDTEVITHRYNAGGSLNHIKGSLHGNEYAYLANLTYDEFEQRRTLELGNGVKTRYHYDPSHRRLCKLESGLTLDQASSNANSCEATLANEREVNSDEEQAALIKTMAEIPAAPKGQFQNINYAYDFVGNILGTANAVAIPRRSDMGGPTVQTFRYDDLYRLESAKGQFSNAQSTQHRYTLAMQYDGIHNIVKKEQKHVFARTGGSERIQRATTYDWDYKYKTNGHTQPHAPTHIGNRTFSYDANGNQLGWEHDNKGSRRSIEWDDENRIQKIGDPKNTLVFAYDDSGTRVLKRGQQGQTAYVNQFFTVRNNALASKHIFAGTSRIATKLEPGQPVGTSPSNNTTTTTSNTVFTTQTTTTQNRGKAQQNKPEKRNFVERVTTFFTGDKPHPGQGLENRSDRANEVAQNTVKNKHLNGGTLPNGNNKGGNGYNGNNANNGNSNDNNGSGGNTNDNGGGSATGNDPLAHGGTFLYYYHPDHLGSTGYVTDEDAELYEHVEYFPFGETWVSEAANSNQRVPYRYTSKEFDEETGLYYYGARYYDPRTSVWQSVDPILGSYLSGKFNGGISNPQNMALYGYSYHNPVRVKDEDGNVGLFGSVFGIGTELVFQGLESALTGENHFNIKGVVVAGAAGFIGASVALHYKRAKHLTKLAKAVRSTAADAAIAGASAYAKDPESLSAAGVLGDVVLGKGMGEAATRLASKSRAGKAGKLFSRELKRARRMNKGQKKYGGKRRMGRKERRAERVRDTRESRREFMDRESVKAGIVGSTGATRSLEAGNEASKDK